MCGPIQIVRATSGIEVVCFAGPLVERAAAMDDCMVAIYASGLFDSMIRLEEYRLVPAEIEQVVKENPSVDTLALAARIYFELSELSQEGIDGTFSKSDLILRGTNTANQALDLISEIDKSYVLEETLGWLRRAEEIVARHEPWCMGISVCDSTGNDTGLAKGFRTQETLV